MKPEALLERVLREIVALIEYTPEDENLNTLLKRLANIGEEFVSKDELPEDSRRLAESFKAIQKAYASDPVDERSLGRVLNGEGLEAYQSYRIDLAQSLGYSPKDERRRIQAAISTVLEEGVKHDPRNS